METSWDFRSAKTQFSLSENCQIFVPLALHALTSRAVACIFLERAWLGRRLNHRVCHTVSVVGEDEDVEPVTSLVQLLAVFILRRDCKIAALSHDA